MSPEQCLGQRVGARSDLYSLGVVLYEMLAGRPPFIDPLPSAVLVKQATAPAPPLPQLRQDIPKQLAIAVHTLLAKRPDNRPRTAAAARMILEQSLVRRRRDVPEADPLSATIAALAQQSSIVFRLAGPLATVIFFGALLFVWGSGGENERQYPEEPPAAAQPAATNALFREAVARKGGNEILDRGARPESSLAVARKIAATAARNSLGDVQVLRTATGLAVVAIHDERKTGAARFFMMHKRGAAFRVSARGMLDTKSFPNARWTAETIDANDDGYNEVLFTGFNARGQNAGYRLIVFVPSTKQIYSVQVGRGRKTPKSIQFRWSANTLSPHVEAYRNVLMEHARSLVR